MTPTSTEPKAALLGQLYELFRRKGYDGVSIGDISAETGLGRSSLYHHFPGGKAEMAQAVLAFTRTEMETNFLAPMASNAPLPDRIGAMLAAVDHAYQSGEGPCVLAALLSASDDGPLSAGLAQLFQDWAAAIAASLTHAGVATAEARRRAITALALIQGGLIIARGLKDRSAFAAALAAANATLVGAAAGAE